MADIKQIVIGTEKYNIEPYTSYVTLSTQQDNISGRKTFTDSVKISGRYQDSGDDEGLIIGRANNNYAGLCLGDPGGIRSVLYLKPDNTAIWRWTPAGSDSYDIAHPGKAGTIALTSDITTAIGNIIDSEETYKTFKKVAEYIADDKTGAAKMIADIAANTTAIANEKTRAEGAESDLGTRITTNASAIEDIKTTYMPLAGGKSMSGAFTMNTGTGIGFAYTSSKAGTADKAGTNGDPWIYAKDAPDYGIRYYEGTIDQMAFSATGNNNNTLSADLCINGAGDGTVTIRGKKIATEANIDSCLPYRLQTATSSAKTANASTSQGWYYISDGDTNRPPFINVVDATSKDYRIMTTAYNSSWLQQIATNFRSNDLFIRRCQNGSWYGWTSIVKMEEGNTSPTGTANAIPRWHGSVNSTLKNSGVTIDDNNHITLPANAQYKGTGKLNVSWYQGRDSALLRNTQSSGYNALWSLKTTNGTWDCGEYNASNYHDSMLFTYFTDAQYNSGNNNPTYQVWVPKRTGTLAIDADLVHNTGDENVDGVKTFTSSINAAGINSTGGADITLKASAAGISANAGDVVYADKDGKELGRIWMNGKTLSHCWSQDTAGSPGSAYPIVLQGTATGGYIPKFNGTYTKIIENGWQVRNNSTAHLEYTGDAADGGFIPTVRKLAYWNGRYNSSTSNLNYCARNIIVGTDATACTTNAVPRYDGNGGAKIKTTGVTIDNSNIITAAAFTSDGTSKIVPNNNNEINIVSNGADIFFSYRNVGGTAPSGFRFCNGNGATTGAIYCGALESTGIKEGGTALSSKYGALDTVTTNTSNITTLQGYFTGGVAKEAAKTSKAVTFNNGGSGVSSGTTFNGSTARTVSYNTVGALGFTSTYTTSKTYFIGKQTVASSTQTYYNSNVYFTGSSVYAGSFYASSDERLKENIKDADTDYYDFISNIRLVKYNWKDDEDKIVQHGVIAQELKETAPEDLKDHLVSGVETDTDYLAVNDGKMVYIALGALQQQLKINQQLESRIARLEQLLGV